MSRANGDSGIDRRLRVTRAVCAALFREEWRLHATLFGGLRFLLVPLVVALFAVGGAAALEWTGTSSASIVAGLHAFAVGFGLYSGTAGFAGSDMLEDVFGELSLVLGTAATLPLSRRWLLGLFLAKDAVYYGAFFVLPMAVSIVALVEFSVRTPLAVVELWLSLWLAFAAGMVLTVSAIAIRTRGVPGAVVGLLVLLGAVALWTLEWAVSLWGFVVTFGDGPSATLTLATGTVVAGAVALAAYDPTYEPPSRTATDRFGRVESLLPTDDPLVAKAILDLARSSGGFAKPFVSVGILFVLVAGLVGVVESITGIAPAPGIFFGGVLGLSAFTTYNWLTQFDDVETYLAYPVSVPDVFRAKRTAFLLVGTPTVALPYLVAIVRFEATLVDAVAGAAVLAGFSLYYYGLTVYVAGFSPNEFLFDGVRFAAFSAGVAVVLLPALLVGFAVVPPTTTVALAFVGASGLLGAFGFELTRRAGRRWAERYRRAAPR